MLSCFTGSAAMLSLPFAWPARPRSFHLFPRPRFGELVVIRPGWRPAVERPHLSRPLGPVYLSAHASSFNPSIAIARATRHGSR
jgi:hypothetical protein